ncbi:MAG: DUF421 domain-containing protein [Alphaproteobacteria bacterium]|nr:DUF421 domain-containing protein [Alphaproteobacteria bacterium]
MYEFISTYGTTVIELLSAFVVVLIFIKLFGMNYQLKQMTAFDLIVNLILGALLGGFITNPNLSTPKFFVIMTIYIIIVYLINMITKKSDWGRRVLIGYPQIIIQDGKIDERMVNRLNLSVHEIAAAMRHQKIRSLTQVKMAQIEPGGDLTIVKKGDKSYSIILIDNGIVDEGALAEIGRTPDWLNRRLAAKGIKDAADVFIAQWHQGRLYIIKKE